MSNVAPGRPAPFIAGLVPTMNHRGFMSERLDPFSARFAQYASGCRAPVLDMGCAYGIATRAALESGATVHACDMDERHVEILAAETPSELRPRLTTSVGTLPDVDFPDGSFDAILCSRVLHFLQGAEIRTTLAKMSHWLTPGGRLFVVADTPYSGFWFSGAPDYERRKADGEEWPGFIADIGRFMKDGKVPEGMLGYLNPLDPDVLARECARAGLVVEEAAFTGRAGESAGRHHAGAVAFRPG